MKLSVNHYETPFGVRPIIKVSANNQTKPNQYKAKIQTEILTNGLVKKRTYIVT